MSLALEGIRVLDCTRFQMGPVATVVLADLGAEVIKIEEPQSGDPARGMMRLRGYPTQLPQAPDRNFYFEGNNRNKKSIVLDLKKPAGREVLYRLVAKSDIFVHNFRVGVAERLKIDYAHLSKHNPRLIYGSVSGYGPKGPEAKEPSFDYLGMARSGMLGSTLGDPGGEPITFSGGLSDQMGGTMLAMGLLAALVVRERLGIGQEVEASHLSSMVWLQWINFQIYLLLGYEIPSQRRTEISNPLWNHYRCADGRWIALAHLQPDRYWPTLCRAVGQPQWEKDPRFDTALHREENSPELIRLLDSIFLTKTSDEWIKTLRGAGDFICCKVQTIPEVGDDPQVVANNYLTEYAHPVLGKTRTIAPPFHLHRTPGAVKSGAPELGEHTEQVLTEIGGYTWEEIARLRGKQVI